MILAPTFAGIAERPVVERQIFAGLTVAGSLLLLTGMVVAVGWFAESLPLIRLRPSWPSMKLNTSLCFALLGAGILAVANGRPRFGLITALLATGVGLATEFQYATGLNLGIDELLRPAFDVEPGVPPGRMSPITAALFVLAGVGLAALCCRVSSARATLAGVLASIIGGIALAALIGHATRTPAAYKWGAVVSVAVHTAGAFIVVAAALGALAASHEKEFPAWLPWSALLAGMACTLALGTALFYELGETASLVPEIVLAVGITLSALMASSVHARRRLKQQRDLLATSLHRAEEALAERARLAAIVESSSDAIMSVNQAAEIVTFNPAAEELFGYSLAEIRGRPVQTLVPPERLAEFNERILGQLRSGGTVRGLRTQRVRRDGRRIDVEVDVALLRDADGTPLGALSMTRDISWRLASEQLMRGVLEAAPDAMLVNDVDGTITLVNSMAERIFGHTRDTLVGMRIEQLVPEQFRAGHAAHRASFTRAPAARSMGAGRELLGLRKDGTVFPIEISLNSFEAAGRKLVVSAVRDITARRAADRRLRDSLEEKELLLKEIHHRVKNNLQVVASMLTLQAMRAEDTQATALLEACRQRVMSMAKVHEKLYGERDMSRVNLSELIRDIGTMVVAGAPGIAVDFCNEGLPVAVDVATAFPAGLIANELLTNSIKHAFPGGSGGRIRVCVSRAEGDLVRIQVSDDGIGGVTPAALESSAGLGSTIVRILVRQLDGVLSIDPGRGTSVSVTFPARRRSE